MNARNRSGLSASTIGPPPDELAADRLAERGELRRDRAGSPRSAAAGRRAAPPRSGGSAIWATELELAAGGLDRVARRRRRGPRRHVAELDQGDPLAGEPAAEHRGAATWSLKRSLAVELGLELVGAVLGRRSGRSAGCVSSSSEALETTSSASPIPIRIPIASAMKTAASEAAW